MPLRWSLSAGRTTVLCLVALCGTPATNSFSYCAGCVRLPPRGMPAGRAGRRYAVPAAPRMQQVRCAHFPGGAGRQLRRRRGAPCAAQLRAAVLAPLLSLRRCAYPQMARPALVVVRVCACVSAAQRRNMPPAFGCCLCARRCDATPSVFLRPISTRPPLLRTVRYVTPAHAPRETGPRPAAKTGAISQIRALLRSRGALARLAVLRPHRARAPGGTGGWAAMSCAWQTVRAA